jgi:transcriptional regulator of aroF, aroG, tyrA and aromatic amino acid transport
MAGYERRIVEETLNNAKSIRKAARSLGISHTALLNKMKKYGIVMGKG